MRAQLLCTFTYMDKLPTCIGQIYKAYTVDGVINLKCYNYVETPNNVVCVYNVETSEKKLQHTISINRKKETNTLYSINALNNLIRALNNGILDKGFVVDWKNYFDTLLLSNGEYDYKQIKIKEL